MNFIAHERAETLVHKLMPGKRPLAGKRIGYHQGRVVSVIFAKHLHVRTRETCVDQSFDFCRIHLLFVLALERRAV